MSSFNKVILLGNLTANPELRVTKTGLSICKFTLAVNRKFTTQNSEEREEVAFIDIDAFGKQAENISKYLSKGSPLLVEGRLRLDRWETPQGEKRSKLAVTLETFRFMGGGKRDESNQNQPEEGSQGTTESSSKSPELDDDVPF